MGKWLDRALLTSLAAAALYLLFLSAFGSILAAACMSFGCCGLILRAFRGKAGRMTRHQAKTLLDSWAYGPDDDARASIARLSGISGANPKLVYLPKHPTASVSVSDVFGAWKSARGQNRLIIAAPCYSDSRARVFARTLQQPSAELLDAPRLISLIRRSELKAPQIPRGRMILKRFRIILSGLPGRRPWYKSLGAGLALMLVYLVSGNAAYLILSVSTLFLAGVSIRARA